MAVAALTVGDVRDVIRVTRTLERAYVLHAIRLMADTSEDKVVIDRILAKLQCLAVVGDG
jgi:DNA-binding GntR family transcriptional regulator